MARKPPKGIGTVRLPKLKEMTKEILAKNKGREKKIKEIGFKLAKKGGWENSCIASGLLRSAKNIVSREEFINIVWDMADDQSWEVRECAAMLLRDLLFDDFDFYLAEMKKMVKNKNPNIRRVAVVSSMHSRLTEVQARKIAKYIYEPLLADDNVYVRKNLGPFAVSQHLRLYPEMTLEFFDAWIKEKKPRVVWNILNAFQPARLRANKDLIPKAKEYLKLFSSSEDKTIQSAIKSLRRRFLNGKGF